MYKISICLGNKYGFYEQIEICREMGFNNLELCEGSPENTFCDLDETEFNKRVIRNKIYIPMLNLTSSTENISPGFLKDIMRKCSLLGIQYLNLADFKDHTSVYNCIGQAAGYSEMYNVKLCIENRSGYFFNNSRNLNTFFKNEGSGRIYMVFNPLEFVKAKQHPFLNVFYNGRFKGSIEFLRICDGIFLDGSSRLPGEGNAEIKEMISALKTRSFRGYLSFMPYFEKHSINDFKAVYESLAGILLGL